MRWGRVSPWAREGEGVCEWPVWLQELHSWGSSMITWHIWGPLPMVTKGQDPHPGKKVSHVVMEHQALKTGLFPRVCILLGGVGHGILNSCSWESSGLDVQLNSEASFSWRSCSRFSWNMVLNLTCLCSSGVTILASLVVPSLPRN